MQNQELQKQYLQQIPDLLSELEKAAEHWKSAPSRETFDLLFTKVLNISGSADMFGQVAIGAVAKSLQTAMSQFFKSHELPSAEAITILQASPSN